MKTIFCNSFSLVFFSIVLLACSQKGEPNIIGKWTLVKSEAITPDEKIRENKFHASMLLFDGSNYFMAWEGGNETPNRFETQFRATEKEMLERFPRLLFNAGKYTKSKTEIEIFPEIAMVPEYQGGSGKFNYHFSEDTLKLIWKEILSVDGTSDPLSEIGFKWRYSWLKVD